MDGRGKSKALAPDSVGCINCVRDRPAARPSDRLPSAALMLLAGLYVCHRFLVDLLLIRQPQAHRDAELLLLRHELSVLRRSVKKPRLRMWDRMILSTMAMRLPRSQWNALIMRPETVLGRNRALVRRKCAAYSRRGRPGRPRMPAECRQLTASGQGEFTLCEAQDYVDLGDLSRLVRRGGDARPPKQVPALARLRQSGAACRLWSPEGGRT